MTSNYEMIVACPADQFRLAFQKFAKSIEYQEKGPSWEKITEIDALKQTASNWRFDTSVQLRVPVSENDEKSGLFVYEVSQYGDRYFLTPSTDLSVILGSKYMVVFFSAVYSCGSVQLLRSKALQKILYDLCHPHGLFALFYDEFAYYLLTDRENCCMHREKDTFISTVTIDLNPLLGPDDSRWISETCDDADKFVAHCLEQFQLLGKQTLTKLGLQLPDIEVGGH